MDFWKWFMEFDESEWILKCVLAMGICAAISTAWEILDVVLYGSPQPSLSDTIICAAFTWTAYKLLRKSWKINGR